MNTPNRPSRSNKLTSMLVVASLLVAPALFAAGGMGGGGGGGGGAQAKKQPAAPPADRAVKDKYDKDKNGKISKDELKVIRDAEKSLFDELMKFDANNNVEIDASELTKWADSKKTKAPAGGGGPGGGPGGGGGRGGA
jgi:uncharacterized membrane protein